MIPCGQDRERLSGASLSKVQTPTYQVKIKGVILVGLPDKPVREDTTILVLMDSINFEEVGV
jgi:hypothetical protein